MCIAFMEHYIDKIQNANHINKLGQIWPLLSSLKDLIKPTSLLKHYISYAEGI